MECKNPHCVEGELITINFSSKEIEKKECPNCKKIRAEFDEIDEQIIQKIPKEVLAKIAGKMLTTFLLGKMSEVEISKIFHEELQKSQREKD